MRAILFVDDHEVLARLSCEILEMQGYRAVSAYNGTEALKKFDEEDFDILVTDFRMDGMNGVELVKSLEKVNPGTRIVLMSGYSPVEVQRIMGDDASSYRSMWKPFEAATLVQTVKNVLDMPLKMKAVRGAK